MVISDIIIPIPCGWWLACPSARLLKYKSSTQCNPMYNVQWTVLNHSPRESQIFQLFFRGRPASGWWSVRLLHLVPLTVGNQRSVGKTWKFVALCVIWAVWKCIQIPQLGNGHWATNAMCWEPKWISCWENESQGASAEDGDQHEAAGQTNYLIASRSCLLLNLSLWRGSCQRHSQYREPLQWGLPLCPLGDQAK